MFRVGPLNADESIELPDNIPNEEDANRATCEKDGRYKCHSAARCENKYRGFCCICNQGYFGNGFSCIKNSSFVRVTGKLTGTLGNKKIDSGIQAHVLPVDGRSYTAVSPLDSDLGFNLQLLQILADPIGWLFAKTNDNTKNGYEVNLVTILHMLSCYIKTKF